MARTTEEHRAPVREEPQLAPAPPLGLRRAVRLGAVGGVAAAFMGAIGMIPQFNDRPVVDGITLAHMVMVGIPMLFGYLAGTPPKQLEGFAPSERGRRNVAAGALAGLATGLLAGAMNLVLAAIAGAPGWRAVFPNVSRDMVDLVTYGLGALAGLPVAVIVGLAAGAAGGAMHLLPDRWRKAILGGILWVGIFGVMETVIAQIIRSSHSLGVDLLIDLFGDRPDAPVLLGLVYEPGGALHPLTAGVIFLAALGIYFWLAG